MKNLILFIALFLFVSSCKDKSCEDETLPAEEEPTTLTVHVIEKYQWQDILFKKNVPDAIVSLYESDEDRLNEQGKIATALTNSSGKATFSSNLKSKKYFFDVAVYREDFPPKTNWDSTTSTDSVLVLNKNNIVSVNTHGHWMNGYQTSSLLSRASGKVWKLISIKHTNGEELINTPRYLHYKNETYGLLKNGNIVYNSFAKFGPWTIDQENNLTFHIDNSDPELSINLRSLTHSKITGWDYNDRVYFHLEAQ